MTAHHATVIGSPISPYARKVFAMCALKGIEVDIDPLVAFFGDERFTKLSPVRRIPVYRDERVTLCDSSVICQYIEDAHPAPHLYPKNIVDRAHARWLEEYADTRMGDVFAWRIFQAAVIDPGVWSKPRDKAALEAAVTTELPLIMDYLEEQVPGQGYIFGDISIAEISIVPYFANLNWARVEPDANRWPKTVAWVGRVRDEAAFADFEKMGDALVRTQIAEHRNVLGEMGVKLTADTHFTATPRRGPLTVR
jgi:glutathione S-transferase